MDVSFREDQSRIHKGAGPQNFATLRRMALSILKLDTTKGRSIRAKRKKAAWDPDYLLELLAKSAGLFLPLMETM